MKNKKQAQYSNHSVLSKRSTECPTPKKHSYPDDTVAKRLLSKKQKRQRQENSLDELTRAFIDYVKEQKQTNISINEVVKKLKVKKRRIYDITNVLEGIGYIKKQAKNQVTWLRTDLFTNAEEESDKIKKKKEEIAKLRKKEEILSSFISQSQTDLTRLLNKPECAYYNYLTFEDLKSISSNNNNVNLIAIKSPKDTTFDIPDPEYTRELLKQTKNEMKEEELDPSLLETLSYEHQLFMESEKGEIKVFVVLTKQEEERRERESVMNSYDEYAGYAMGNSYIMNNRKYSLSSTSSKIMNRSSFNESNLIMNSVQQ